MEPSSSKMKWSPAPIYPAKCWSPGPAQCWEKVKPSSFLSSHITFWIFYMCSFRFTTTGEQALMFEIFKYGRPDPHMERPHDISVCLVMASVRYLHTMRFLKEVLAFCSHFPQLIDAFQRMKALAQGNLVRLLASQL